MTAEAAEVVILGAGPGGLAAAACLSHRRVPHLLPRRIARRLEGNRQQR